MALDRRSFLAAIGVTAAGASSVSGAADDDIYIHAGLELALRRPDGWHWLTRSDYEILKDSFQTPGGDEEKEELLETTGRPFLALCEKPPHGDEFGASIIVWVEPHLAGDRTAPHVAHERSYELYGDYLEGFEFVRRPQRYEMCGIVGSRCEITYTERHEGDPPRHAQLVSTMVRHRGHWFTFNFGHERAGWTSEAKAVFDQFESEVRLGGW